jgi:hypothetical protein
MLNALTEKAMRTKFKSGDIQRLLGVQKQRVEYLSLKIPIPPEVEQVGGTGRAHLYSFRNALQFAIAQEVSNLGLYLTEIRSILEMAQKLSEGETGEEVYRNLVAANFTGSLWDKIGETVVSGPTELKGFFSEDDTPRQVYLVIATEAKGQQESKEGRDANASHLWFPVSDLGAAMEIAREEFGLVVLNLGKIRDRVVTFADGEE